jgi:hypothetical protein
MSTLNVANITDGTDTVETGFVVRGSVKVWARYDAASVVAESLNVSSTVDSSTVGATDVNFTNAFDSGGYSAQATCNGSSLDRFVTISFLTPTYYRAYSFDGAVRTDVAVGTMAVGDLA